MQTGSRGFIVAFVIMLVLGLNVLQPSGAQPAQWRSINPVFSDLNDVWMVTANNGWAVGASGRAIFWDGSKWQEVSTPFASTDTLNSVSCLSASRCLAVGANATGAILMQWDGTAWVDRSGLLPAGVSGLGDVFIRSDGLAFVVGAGTPNILRIPNANTVPITVASEATVGAPDTLNSVYVLPPSTLGTIQGFAVGDDGALGTTWRWDGSAGGWGNSHSPGVGVGTLRGVQMLDSTHALAVGDSDVRTRWNGASWTPEGGPVIAGTTWRAAFIVSGSDQWMVGDVTAPNVYASIAHWNGIAWTAFAVPNVPVAANLNSIYMLSSSDGWAVGDGGVIIRWNGSNWKSVASPVVSPNNIRGVWLASSSDGWAVGDAGQIIRWNGANWGFYQTAPVATQLNAIHGSSSAYVYAVGNASVGVPPVIVRWAGATWTDVSPPGIAIGINLHGVFTVSPSLAFAVGDAPAGAPATMLKWDGTNWGSIPSGTANDVSLRSVWMASSTDGWAVGSGGAIVRWNGLAWSTETSPTAAQLNAVQVLTSTNVWAAGDSGTILHRDAVGWSIVASGVAANLNSLYMVSATEGWAVGDDDASGPVLLFWNGLTWSRVFPIPTHPNPSGNDDLSDVWMVASLDGWAVGQDGLILRLGPATVTTTSTSSTSTTSASTTSTTSTSSTTTTSTSTTSSTTGTTSTASTSTSTTSATSTTTSGPFPPPSPCIIATATFGSEVSPAVQFLRSFRDRLILSTKAGSAFMYVFNAWYYSFSPSVAKFIASHDSVRGPIKAMLYPLVGILSLSTLVYLTFGWAPEFAVVIAGLVASSLIGLVYLTPVSVICIRCLLRRRPRATALTRASLIVISCALVFLGIGEMAGSIFLLAVASSAIVLPCLVAPPLVAALAMLRPNSQQ